MKSLQAKETFNPVQSINKHCRNKPLNLLYETHHVRWNIILPSFALETHNKTTINQY